MRRHWVDSASEIDVMREVKILDFREGSCGGKFEKETTLVTVLVSDFLDDFLDLWYFGWTFLCLEFGCVFGNQLWIPFGNLALATAFAPNLLNYGQDFSVDFPWDWAQIVQNTEQTFKICVFHKSLLDFALAISHEVGGLKIIPSDLRLNPR